MANQVGKKEHHHYLQNNPEGSEEDVDKEWEDFTRLMAKLRQKSGNRPHRYRQPLAKKNYPKLK